ncbi:hypothetical protein IE81DRAFT_325412 [Ceraceosorus guamensis]|uniref:Pre-mRNA-splicing factor CWC26 n=1 Tax=Ceraceosorus guamensis TaxID=1522189 RepID=A0A316VT05_9BASI|nr:hypothetical protein IE81DRAFT_325412 [Ceraceosorus guamensis]PWN40622.1 hypothetical protein IE81DRAFT_325412 [Ceraceosorus guamensis]
MPDPNLQAYLASRYLSGPKADAILARSVDGEGTKRKRKKRRANDAADQEGLKFTSAEDESWKGSRDEDDLQAVVVDDAASQRRKWSRLGQTKAETSQSEVDAETSAADANDARGSPASAGPSKPQFKAGLKSREEMKAERLAREEEARAKALQGEVQSGNSEPDTFRKRPNVEQEETVYRDSSGRKMDLKEEEAKRKREEVESEKKEREKGMWNVGEVQKKMQKEARERERLVGMENFARGADDLSRNAELKSVERADDPALRFLTKKREEGPQKPKYKGPRPPPNRFGILPGYRWDGVDRGNGFEAKYFRARNEREDRKRRDY